MKNLIISGIISIGVLPLCFAQDSKDAKNLPAVKYIAVKSFNSASSIPLVDVNEFLTLIADYAVENKLTNQKELKYPSYQDFLTAINNQLNSGQM
ncbi:MAG: hypothetical protein LBG74_00795 [Spirochaetaceae bacterium]|jgi:hypothetical protein|nr:hypothetical protein [Spirochaetaceae bacterium]